YLMDNSVQNVIYPTELSINQKSRNYKMSIFTSYEREVKIIRSLIQDLFCYRAGIYKRNKQGYNKKNSYDIYVCSKPIVEFLSQTLGIPTGNKSYSVRAPKIFFEAPVEDISSFIRGVIDGDGCIKSNKSVHIYSGSPLFLSDMKLLLEKVGAEISSIKQLPTAWELTIYRKNSLNLLYNRLYPIGCPHYPRKKAAWETNIFK
ncbi:MAG: LAGLIDADG family homing endonuclease, partial [Nanoarchaeota archaeon]|nr:LAGLIDADG family homing endonuclease [Nanoarchaeota archaeon]